MIENSDTRAELTAFFILAAAKVLLAHNVAPAAILAMVDHLETLTGEAAQALRDRQAAQEEILRSAGFFQMRAG